MYLTGIKSYFHLKRNLTRPLKEVKEEQWKALRNIVTYAFDKVPFYQSFYKEHDFHPSQLRSPDDIGHIPLTHKALFQTTDESDLISRDFDLKRLVRKRTSGSSGSPLNIYYTPEDRIHRTILHLRILFHNGMTFRDTMAHISDSRNVPDFRYTFQKLGFLPKHFIYAADAPDRQLVELAKIDPKIIYSYASSMVLLSSEIEKLIKCPIQPKLVFTTGELLNFDDRELINRAFCVKLRDIYGIVEMGDVAWQCPAIDGYHINIDSFLVEVLKDGNPVAPGEQGKLVITNLHSKAMPFIRYEIGDVVTGPREDECSCGCQFPKIDVLQGRADDWLYTADGKRISPLIFVIASIPGVQQYRMIQKDYDSLVVEILPGPHFSEETLQKTADHVIEVMGSGVEVEVVQVNSIPQQSGKMRRVISEIDAKK